MDFSYVLEMPFFFFLLRLVAEKETKQHKDTGINSASTCLTENRVSSTELLLIHIKAAESRICPVAWDSFSWSLKLNAFCTQRTAVHFQSG